MTIEHIIPYNSTYYLKVSWWGGMTSDDIPTQVTLEVSVYDNQTNDLILTDRNLYMTQDKISHAMSYSYITIHKDMNLEGSYQFSLYLRGLLNKIGVRGYSDIEAKIQYHNRNEKLKKILND